MSHLHSHLFRQRNEPIGFIPFDIPTEKFSYKTKRNLRTSTLQEDWRANFFALPIQLHIRLADPERSGVPTCFNPSGLCSCIPSNFGTNGFP
ncbi:hypothetical protein D3C71_1804320 [compost metagenome]